MRKIKQSHKALLAAFVSIFMVGCMGTGDQKGPEKSTSDIAAQVDWYLKGAESAGMSGAVLLAKDGEIILRKGYGMADREQKKSVLLETGFDIGSVTKQFTAAAILKLEMEGKLSVNDPMNKYLDNFPSDKAKITIHHLLTHTSGIRGGFGGDYDDLVTRDELVERVRRSDLLWEPGTKYRYSNAGYSMLGAIIEYTSGQPYEEYVIEKLLKPAGLMKTGYLIPEWDKKDLAVGYRNDKRWGTPLDGEWLPDGPGWNLRTNGGFISTVDDMFLWIEALKGEKILSKEAKAKLFTPHVQRSGNSSYGYGWGIRETPRGTRLISHGGGTIAFNADYRWWIDEDIVLIMFTNNNKLRVGSFTPKVAEIIFGTEGRGKE